MAEQDKVQVNESTNGGAQTGDVQRQVEEQTGEIAAAYEKARQEMMEALSRLRAEVEKIDMAQARQQAENWVKENPTLAGLLALGGGILVGRLLSSTFTPAPPPPLPVRMRDRAYGAASHARDYLEDVGEAFLQGAAVTSGVLAQRAGKTSRDISRRAQHLGRDVAHRSGEVAGVVSRRAAELGEAVAERAADFSEEFTERAGRAAKSLETTAHDLSTALRKNRKKTKKRVKKKAGQGMDAAEAALNAARTVIAAVLVKRVNDWIKRVS